MRSLNKLQPWSLFLLRLAVGVTMVYNSHGKVYSAPDFQHGRYLAPLEHFNDFVVTLGLPRWLGYVSTVTEFVGGVCLVLGLLTRFWAFLIAGNMLVALVTVNYHHGYSGSEYTLALISMSLLLVTTGSGALALDRRFGLS